MIQVRFKKHYEDVNVPVKATKSAGAFDVYAHEIIKESNDCYLVKLGFSVEFPEDYKMIIAPRSSITKTKWNIQNTPGIGDADYRGEYSIRFRAFPDSVQFYSLNTEVLSKEEGITLIKGYTDIRLEYPEFPYKVGERCAQIYFQKIEKVNFFVVDNLSETERGSGAYGSTGKI